MTQREYVGKTGKLIAISFQLLFIYSAIRGFVSPAIGYTFIFWFRNDCEIALNRF